MKMIEVLDLMAKGEIEEGSILKIVNEYDELYRYEYHKLFLGFKSVVGDGIEGDFEIDKDFLNIDVELIPPKPKKYYLRLDKDDNFSYINKNVYFSYEVANKSEHTNYKTKFTQDEIDESVLLKFIEQYGVKEEVKDSEND